MLKVPSLQLKATLIWMFMFFSLNTFSQTVGATMKGKIIDADGTPMASLTVRLKKFRAVTVTNNNGLFIFHGLPALQDTLIISSVNSKSLFQAVSLSVNETIDIGIIRLEYNVKQLQSVEVNGRKAHSYLSDYSFFGEKTEMPVADIPQAISTVTKELIQDKMEFTLKEALNDIAGVNQYSGYDEYTIRGFRAENARDIDGLRGYNTTYTSTMLVNIERIEVIKGPTATLYGNCDPGGTINLVTKKPLDATKAQLDLYQGDWNHYRAQGDITGPLDDSKTLLYRFNAGYDNTNSFREQSHAKSFELAPSLTLIPNSRLRVNVNFSVSHINTVLDQGQPGYDGDNNLELTPISLSMSQPGDYLHDTDIASIISASYKINKNLTFSTAYLNYITRENVATHGLNNYITPDSISLYYSTWTYHTVTNTSTNYFTYKFHTGKVNHLLLAGYDFVKSAINLNQHYYELPNQFGADNGIVGTFSLKNPQYFQPPVNTYQLSNYDNDEADVDGDIYHTQGIYLQDQADFGKWNILGSLREEFYIADDGSGLNERVFLPRIGIVYALEPNTHYYVTYNAGFDPFEASTTTQVFNAPFKPNTSQLMEIGVKGSFLRNHLAASVAVYQLTVQNVAVNANVISNPNLFVQQGENRSRGIETEVTGNILSNLSVNLSYAYCLAIVTKSKIPLQIGTRVENAPKNTSCSWIKYTFTDGFLKGVGISAGHSGVGERETLDSDITLPGYLLINGGVHYAYKDYRVALNVYNLTNETYWEGAYNNVNKWPGAPRNYMINLGYMF
jgi:iron complex outermembrane receptor protein